MRFFSSFHDPKTKRYIPYYSAVLIIAMSVIILTLVQVIHQSPVQIAATFFEGFFSLFMLARNEKVGNAFLIHMSYIKLVPRF